LLNTLWLLVVVQVDLVAVAVVEQEVFLLD
jgi:hypothetical protein